MRIKLCSLILALLLIRLSNLYGQSQADNYSKYNLGIDFLRFNRNWIYFPERLNSMDGKNYHPYFTPSVFFKINEGNHSLRFKYEYLRCKYWLVTGGQTDLYEELKGLYTSHRILTGYEKLLINKGFKFSVFFDFGILTYNYIGTDYTAGGITQIARTVTFNLHGEGFDLQPGFSIQHKIYKNLFVTLETSVCFEKRYGAENFNYINSGLRFIPRPISLFGFNYNF